MNFPLLFGTILNPFWQGGQLHRNLKYEDRRVFECSYGIEVRLSEQSFKSHYDFAYHFTYHII